MKKQIGILAVFVIMLIQLSTFGMAQEGDDIEVFGLEAELLLNLGSGILALGLFGLTAAAYKRDKRQKFLYVSVAFLLFAIKGFLTSTELFMEELPWIDPIASFLNFAILLSFFVGVLKK